MPEFRRKIKKEHGCERGNGGAVQLVVTKAEQRATAPEVSGEAASVNRIKWPRNRGGAEDWQDWPQGYCVKIGLRGKKGRAEAPWKKGPSCCGGVGGTRLRCLNYIRRKIKKEHGC